MNSSNDFYRNVRNVISTSIYGLVSTPEKIGNIIVSFINRIKTVIFKMKICVYDNLANNAYNITKFLRKRGFNAELGLDPDDRFPMSQPTWEEIDFEMPVNQFSDKSIEYWLNLERKNGYVRPNWIRYLGDPTWSTGNLLRTNLKAVLKKPITVFDATLRLKGDFLGSLYVFLNAARIAALAEYDFVIALGLGPSLAYLAKIRYISIPFGGDLLVTPFEIDNPRWIRRIRAKIQRKAYQNSDFIFLGNDPTYPDALRKIGVLKKWRYCPFPIDYQKYRPLPRQSLEEIISPEVARMASDKTVLLMPSRLDFKDKGSDKVIRAFARLVKEKKNVFLLMLDWGADLEHAKKMVVDLGIQQFVYFHPFVISKPRLIRLINAVDIVLDQFTASGAYGTTSMETMACGKPLCSHVNFDKLSSFHDNMPPIMNAYEEDEIYNSISNLCSSELREKIGREGRDWTIENQSERNFYDAIKIITQDSYNTN